MNAWSHLVANVKCTVAKLNLQYIRSPDIDGVISFDKDDQAAKH